MPLEDFAREFVASSCKSLAAAVTPVMQSKRLHIQVADRTAQSPNPVKASLLSGLKDRNNLNSSTKGRMAHFFSMPI